MRWPMVPFLGDRPDDGTAEHFTGFSKSGAKTCGPMVVSREVIQSQGARGDRQNYQFPREISLVRTGSWNGSGEEAWVRCTEESTSAFSARSL